MVAIIPLSLLSRVELGLLTVSQGLLSAAVLLTQLFKVEQGLSVLGEAVLLVSVEQGLMPRLRAVRILIGLCCLGHVSEWDYNCISGHSGAFHILGLPDGTWGFFI